ncbi:MAG TPA: YggT family protein [Armatimonadota bacterium]|nr:YggT family protein [Armatimonadota bacterium]
MLFGIVNLAINALIALIIVRAVLSWIPEVTWRYRGITRWVERITEPVLQPFRRLVPPHKTGGLDISPVLAIIALGIVRQVVIQFLPRLLWR